MVIEIGVIDNGPVLSSGNLENLPMSLPHLLESNPKNVRHRIDADCIVFKNVQELEPSDICHINASVRCTQPAGYESGIQKVDDEVVIGVSAQQLSGSECLWLAVRILRQH